MRNFRQILEQRKGQQVQVEKNLKESETKLLLLQDELKNNEEAQAHIQTVAQATQEQLKFQIKEIVTLALAAVFDNPYEFEPDFQQRRNQTECDLWFVRNGERLHPFSASGLGAVDVAAFALRVALYSLQKPHTRPILILDEPFHRLKGEEANKRAIQMVKMVSEKLKLQILMVSDERVAMEDIEAGADRVIHVKIRKGVSNVTTTGV